MPLVDSRGRLFGMLNLIDAAIVLFLLAVIPIGFVTYRVFRVPTPEITSVTPAAQPPGPDRRIHLAGHDFRPYLHAYVNKAGQPFSLVNGNPEFTEGRFLVETPTLVEIKLPELPPGTYDLRLFDERQQVAERLNAFAITTAPPLTIDIIVRFIASSDLISLVKPGDEDTFVPVGPPLPPNQARATLKSAKVVAMTDEKLAAIEVHLASQPGGWFGMQEHGEVLEAVVAIPVTRGDTGAWEYKKQAIRAGDTLKFETSRYAMYGVIRRVNDTDASQMSTGGGQSK
jgi:hypothetical protein